jgi:energy-coupling factor transporter ATP-binding protein EcfA2
MIQVDAEILLIDEVLAVGDAAFQQKCFDEFQRLRDRNASVVLVTHDMTAAQRFCDRAMLLEKGEVADLGDTAHVASHYLQLNFGSDAATQQPESGEEVERWGDGRARILEAWFEDDDGERTDVLEVGHRCTHAMRVRFAEDVLDPAFTLVVEHLGGIVMFTADAGIREPTGLFTAGEEVVFRVSFDNVLTPDRYTVTPAVADGGGLRIIDRPVRLQTLTVTGYRSGNGLMSMPYEVQMDRSHRPEQVG